MDGPIVVTGGRGFVAGSVIVQASGHCDIHAFARKKAEPSPPDTVWRLFDLRDSDSLHKALGNIRPRAIIHTAAIADIDFCEAHKNEATEVNAEVTRNLAEYCNGTGAKLVFTSTDNVYDGERGHYDEDDPTAPINFYGKTKVEGEGRVASMTAPWVIARVALVMGLPVIGSGNSFLSRMLSVLEKGDELGVPDKEVRSPIDVITLGCALLELALGPVTGKIQLGGNDALDRHAMAQRIAARLGYDPATIMRTNPEKIPGRAPRPRDASLNNTKATRTMKTAFLGVEEGLDRILEGKEGRFPKPTF